MFHKKVKGGFEPEANVCRTAVVAGQTAGAALTQAEMVDAGGIGAEPVWIHPLASVLEIYSYH